MSESVGLVGQAGFVSLNEASAAPGFAPKYSIELTIDKYVPTGNPADHREQNTLKLAPELWAVWVTVPPSLRYAVEKVCEDTWDSNATAQLSAIVGAIQGGVKPRFCPISIQDGDKYKPDYNGGKWWVKPTRRPADQGPAKILRQKDGAATDDPLETPVLGDRVGAGISVWAQPQHDRVNFTVDVVRKLGAGTRSIAASQASPELVEALASLPADPVLTATAAPAQPQPAVQAQAPQVAPQAAIPEPTLEGAAQVAGAAQAPSGPPAANLFENHGTAQVFQGEIVEPDPIPAQPEVPSERPKLFEIN